MTLETIAILKDGATVGRPGNGRLAWSVSTKGNRQVLDPQRMRFSPLASANANCVRTGPPGTVSTVLVRPKRWLSSGPACCLVVWKLDRLGRPLPHLLTTATDFKGGVAFRSLNEQVDTTTPRGELLFHVAGSLTQFERSLIREMAQAGLGAAQRRGHPPARLYRHRKLAVVTAAPPKLRSIARSASSAVR